MTLDEYHLLTPERIELYEGYLFGPVFHHEPRRMFLQALMKNEGLLNVVKLAPPELWQEGLNLTTETHDS